MSALPRSKKVELCISIINEHFGPVCGAVCRYIVDHERNSARDIVLHFSRANQLSADFIRDSLIVLLHHNCIELFVETPDDVDEDINGPPPPVVVSDIEYKLNTEGVISRLRFPHLITSTLKNFGSLGAAVMEELIHGGRLSVTQLIEKMEIIIAKGKFDNHGEPDGGASLDDVRRVFAALIQRRYIVPAPTIEVLLGRMRANATSSAAALEEAKNAGSAARKRKRADAKDTPGSRAAIASPAGGAVVQVLSEKQAAPKSHSDSLLPLEMRLMMQNRGESPVPPVPNGGGVVDSAANSSSHTSGAGGGKRGGRGGAGGRGRGRGRGGRTSSQGPAVTAAGSGNADAECADDSAGVAEGHVRSAQHGSTVMGPRDDVLWTYGWEQIIREHRHEICVDVSGQRMGSLARRIVQLMLAKSASVEVGLRQSHSTPMGLLDICDALRGEAAGEGTEAVDIQTVRQVMELMRCDGIGIIDKVSGSEAKERGTQYMVNIGEVVEAVRNRLVHDIADEKFGKESARIIELLLKYPYLEQQKLSEMAILPARGGRERLYDLLKHHWVEYVELSKRADYNPSSTFFFWTMNRKKVLDRLVDDLYGAMLNLRTRRSQEFTMGKDLLDFSHNISDHEEEKKFNKLSQSLTRLDDSVVKIIENVVVLGTL